MLKVLSTRQAKQPAAHFRAGSGGTKLSMINSNSNSPNSYSEAQILDKKLPEGACSPGLNLEVEQTAS
jgi:hypothetical protein